ncbi:hypothetical protein KY290_033132 [Solanum tuberosum]|uniref:Uncharacterized protein n=1 Tax=Solanum tuberosum TaxID=4113 RepID=A0ABQ7U1B8_SOLTU|nr:hypothetical protein KY290_033132 [Solanum tuberosum]
MFSLWKETFFVIYDAYPVALSWPHHKVFWCCLNKANRHTIVLMQTSQNRATRTFMDYESISQAMDGNQK